MLLKRNQPQSLQELEIMLILVLHGRIPLFIRCAAVSDSKVS